MNFLTGPPILIDDITLDNIRKYPIWITTFNEYGIQDQEVYQRPIIDSNDVTTDIENPFITLRVKDTAYYAFAEYYRPGDCLNKIEVWFNDTWIMPDEIPGLQTPVFLVSIPLIDGVDDVEFMIDSAFMFAERVLS